MSRATKKARSSRSDATFDEHGRKIYSRHSTLYEGTRQTLGEPGEHRPLVDVERETLLHQYRFYVARPPERLRTLHNLAKYWYHAQ